jgi:hypothetical protein
MSPPESEEPQEQPHEPLHYSVRVSPRANREMIEAFLHLEAIESRRFERETRRLLHQRYHVYYTVQDDTADGPLVNAVHVCHASRRPLTLTEARAVREEW